MPELPEVETTVRGLKKEIIGRKIINVWTDWPNYFKKPTTKTAFSKCVVGWKIEDVYRKGKNVLIELSPPASKQTRHGAGNKILLIHQKMSGHLLVGKWRIKSEAGRVDDEKWKNEKWIPSPFRGTITDPRNRFIRLIFFLDDGRMLALSDLRRFAKALCGTKNEILNSSHLKLGLNPLGTDFSFEKFKEVIEGKKARIKTFLMNQSVISGIGNIYSDEMLWKARIHPLTPINKIDNRKLRDLYKAIKSVLKKSVRLRGTSIDDYRDSKGRKGKYERELIVYQRDGEPCPRCGEKIKKTKIGGRTARFCPKCQSRN